MVPQILFQFAESFWGIVWWFFQFLFHVAVAWWWLFLPFFLFRPVIFFWLWWRKEIFQSRQRNIYVEIKMPQDVQTPVKAMEDVFSSLWQIHDPPNPREKWLEGQYQLSLSLEIVSTEGVVHFYLRIPEKSLKLVETSFYSHYPTAELQVVDDYTRQIPQDIPSKEWDLWGTSYVLEKPSPYPIKTYTKFFEPSPEGEEEKKVDPMAHLVEGLSTLGKGEHLWLQFILTPILHTAPDESTLVQEGNDIVAELVRRKVPKHASAFGGIEKDFQAVGTTLLTGSAPTTVEQAQEIFPPEMKLTPGEREIVAAIEEKISKYAFLVSTRFIYIAKRENYFGPAKALPMSYFTQFSTATYNNFRPFIKTITKSYTVLTWFLDKRRLFVLKRRILRLYLTHNAAFYPNSKGRFVLNIEELATIFHFPGKMVAPSVSVPRVEAKKGEAPPGLPTE